MLSVLTATISKKYAIPKHTKSECKTHERFYKKGMWKSLSEEMKKKSPYSVSDSSLNLAICIQICWYELASIWNPCFIPVEHK